MKTIIGVLIALLFLQGGKLAAQNTTGEDKALLQLYSPQYGKEETGTDTNVWLVKTNREEDYKKMYKGDIKRQIAGHWFIIEKANSLSFESASVAAYYKANFLWKLSPSLLQLRNTLDRNKPFTFLIYTEDSLLFIPHPAQLATTVIKNYIHHGKTVQLTATLSFIVNTIIKNPMVTFIDIKAEPPKEEMVVNDYDNSVNAINLFFSKYPAVNGNNLSASIKENLFDTTDIDVKERYQPTTNTSAITTTHATTMATLIGGGGNSFRTSKGIAWGTKLSSSDFANLLPDSDSSYHLYKTSVQNHSYGTRIENFYGADAAAFDEAALNNPKLVFVFSAGNSGTLTDSAGPYKNVARFANITGSFKQAKNIILAGSVDSFYRVPAASSKGPAYDGRIKPELVAYGNDGSSGAAAITSGTALAAQSIYASQHHDSLPDNALVKAVLINSADDIFNEGPDYYSGYGNVNTYEAVREMSSGNFFFGNAVYNSIDSFKMFVPGNIKSLKITLVWNDVPAQPNTLTALVNDLDLSLKSSSTHEIWLPWVLHPSPDSSLLLSLPQRARDSLNVVEQITVSQPAKGEYTAYVKGYGVTTLPQPFYVVYELDTANRFGFISPSSDDHFTAGGKGIIRWKNSYSNATGRLQYSTDKGVSWQLAADAVSLSGKYYSWQVPDTVAIVLMRMTIGTDVYTSDTFDLSRQLFPQVVLNCSDSAVVKWNSSKGISRYQVFQLGEQYLQDYAVVNDTSFTIKNSASPYIAVAPLFNGGRTGLNSYTFNYTQQGAGCYINNFLVNLTLNNQAQLLLTLGAISGIDSVQFQQQVKDIWQTLSVVHPVTDVNVGYTYSSLFNGINTFRAVVWVNGNKIIGSTASILYFKSADFIAKPNPLRQGQNLSLLSSTLVTGTLAIYDVWGRKLLQQEVNNAQNTIVANTLAKGVYFLIVYDGKQEVFKSKLLVE